MPPIVSSGPLVAGWCHPSGAVVLCCSTGGMVRAKNASIPGAVA
jgi:hypothetical protein